MKEFSRSLVEAKGGFIVAAFGGDCIQSLEGHGGLEVLGCFGQGLQLLEGRLHVLVAVMLPELALGVDGFGKEVAGPEEVEVVVVDVMGAVIDLLGEAGRNVAEAEYLATVEPCLDSTRALSMVLRERDLVCSMRRFSRSVATGPLMYSVPLSLWKP